MISSILHVLGYILMIVLLLLGVLVLLLGLLLFVPIRYSFTVDKDEGWNKEAFCIRVKAFWLLGVLRFRLELFNPQVMKLKLFFFPLTRLKKKKQKSTFERRKPSDKKNLVQKQTQFPKESDTVEKKTAAVETSASNAKEENHGATGPSKEREVNAKQETNASTSGNKITKGKLRNRIRRIIKAFQKIPHTVQQICARIKEVWQFLCSEELAEGIRYLKGKAGKLIKHLLPHKLWGKLIFGCPEPDQTGYLLGLICMIKGIKGYHRLQVEPRFEESICVISLKGSGRIRLFTVLYLAFSVYFNKNLRELLAKIKKEES